MVPWLVSTSAILLLYIVFGGLGLVESHTAQIVIDAYPNTGTVKWGSTVVLVCKAVGVPSTTVLSYQWTCPGGSCDAGAVDLEWAAKVQQDNILVVNVRNGIDGGNYTCSVIEGDSATQQVGVAIYTLSVPNGLRGLSLLNEEGGLKVFFPNNSFVTNTTLTHTDSPRGENQGAPRGNDHIVCYGMSQFTTRVIWRNSSGVELEDCGEPCRDCGPKCVRNGGVGKDSPLLRFTRIHMYTNSTAYVNQDLECRLYGQGSSSVFIGVYLKNGVNTALQPPSSITQGATTTTAVSVSWSQVSGASGFYVSYQRQDLGAPPVVTPQYEKTVGGATSITLSGLEPGTTYRIRVWSTDGTSVSSEAREMDVTIVENTPTPPRMLTTAGNTTSSSVELNWLPPLHPNGAIRYEIEYEPAVTSGDPVNAGNSSSPYFTLTLPNEFVTYNVRVTAVNTQALGSGQSINISVCLGKNREEGPDSPTGVAVEANGCDSATVSWNQTQSRMCDATIVGYSLRYQLSGSSDYTTVNTSGTSVTLAGLTPNADYTVSVADINSIGDLSAYSVISFNITDPGAPSGVSATVTGCDSAEVTWMPSMSMFGDPIMNYSVAYQRTSGGVLTTVNSPSTSARLQGLVPNAEYNVSVAGINSCGGTSPYISTVFTLQDPAPPTGVSVMTGTECNTADVSWSPSTVNYNAVIGNYSVRYRLRGSSGGYTTAYSPTTSTTLRGLDRSAEYDVEVAAIDLCGRMSGLSEVASLDLQAPGPPTGVSVRDGVGCYTSVVSWTAPQTMCGVVIGNYSVRYRLKNGGGNYTTVHSPTTSVTLEHLVPYTEYIVSVAAINSAGDIGSFTGSVEFDLQEPKTPTEVSINAIGVESVVVSWTASQSSCDDVIANYTVTYRLRDGLGAHTSVNSATTSVTICDLVPNAEYTVSVAAINSMGDVSVYSAETLFVVNKATAPVTVPISPSGPTATPAGTAQVSDCVDVPIAAGAAAASFIGGVLLTTAVAAAVAGAILCRAKRKVNHDLVHTTNTLYEDQHPDMECNPAYVLVNKKVEDDQSLQSIPRCDTYI